MRTILRGLTAALGYFCGFCLNGQQNGPAVIFGLLTVAAIVIPTFAEKNRE